MVFLKFQKLDSRAILPSRGSSEACGLDLYSIEDHLVGSGQRIAVRTGLAVALPKNFYGRIAPRSGLALKMGIDVLGGVIDFDYRGEIKCLVINFGEQEFKINSGDRIAQLIVERVAILEPKWVSQLVETSRGNTGFGSSGK